MKQQGHYIQRLFWLAFLSTAFAGRVSADEYEVQGVLSYRMISRSRPDSIIVDQEQKFSISVDGCKWFLKKTPEKFVVAGRSREMEDYTEASTDLTNFYFLTSFGEAVKSKTNVINTASGIIGRGIVPYGKDPTIGLLWYAFASGCFFQSVSNEYIYGVTPFRNIGYYSKDFRVKATWEINSAPPRLPQYIIFSGRYKFQDDDPNLIFPEPLNPTNCVYRVIEFTNVYGLAVPLKGIAEFPSTNSIVTKFEFTVLSVTNRGEVKDFAIKIPSTALLSDLRPIATLIPVTVATGPTKSWPELAVSKATYARIAEHYKAKTNGAEDNRNRVYRISILTFFFVVSLLFGWLVFFLRSKTQNRKE